MTITFDQNMNNSINISCINDTNTWVFIMPANRRQDDDDFDLNSIQFEWNVTSFTQT